jgi:DNA-binding NtrC family response regulator
MQKTLPDGSLKVVASHALRFGLPVANLHSSTQNFTLAFDCVARGESMAISGMTRNRRVVIIDDDPAFAELLTKIVGSLGYDAAVKADPRASHTYEIRDDDIVIVDVLMPYVSGIQVLEQLARQGVKCGIVLMSGNDDYLVQAEAKVKKLDLQFLGALYKPFRLPDVKAILDTA